MLEVLAKSSTSRVLLLFPTKALAQDQLRVVHSLCSSFKSEVPIRCATLDGDTPFPARKDALMFARILLTNPDMLHYTLLPQFSDHIGRDLALVVIDEAHVYVCVLISVSKTHF
jgi:DEAD/DEAH box helicase domain-containing protein